LFNHVARTGDAVTKYNDLRNHVLWHAIHDNHASVAAFCREHNIKQQKVGALLNLTRSPYTKKGELTPTALKLCEATGISASELFDFWEHESVLMNFVTNQSEADKLRTYAHHDPVCAVVRLGDKKIFRQFRWREDIDRDLCSCGLKDLMPIGYSFKPLWDGMWKRVK
jgi:hypothetical protein